MSPPESREGEDKENVCHGPVKEESSSSDEDKDNEAVDDEASTESDDMDRERKTSQSEETPLEIGEHYLARRIDDQWCTFLILALYTYVHYCFNMASHVS